MCVFPKTLNFSDQQKEKIKKQMSLVVEDFDKKFSFRKEDYLFINNFEFEFLKSIIDVSKNKSRIETLINQQLLSQDCLFLSNDKIFNSLGSTANISIELSGNVRYAKKEPKGEDDIKYIINENKIYNDIEIADLYNYCVKRYQYGNNFLLLELANETLESYIKHNKLSFEEQKNLCLQLCDAVDSLNRNGILHRDLQPNNIFIFYYENKVHLKLGDFGFSIRDVDIIAEKITPRIDYGVPDYISPEQKISISNCNNLTEIYSVGRLINFIMKKKPNNLHHLFGLIAAKCCQSNPAQRYQSLGYVANLLRQTNA